MGIQSIKMVEQYPCQPPHLKWANNAEEEEEVVALPLQIRKYNSSPLHCVTWEEGDPQLDCGLCSLVHVFCIG